MTDRKAFLAALGAAGALLAGTRAEAQSAAPAAAASPEPSPAEPPPAKKPKRTSAAALATAGAMRRFDPHLTEAEVAAIAAGIDDNATSAREAFVSAKFPLHNSDEPITVFTVRES